MYVHVVPEVIERGSAQELEKQIMLKDVPKPDVVIAAVTDVIESEVVTQLDPSLQIAEDQKTESIPQYVGVKQEDCIPEVVDDLQTITAVFVSPVNEEASNVQDLEKTVFTEEPPALCVDKVLVTNEPKHEEQLSAVQVSVEREKESEIPGAETKTAAVEHAVVAQVIICNLKDVSVAIPNVLVEKTSAITEPLIGKVTSQLEFKKEVETATSLVRDGAETAEEGSVVLMMHVPSVEFEDNHRIQVQVVDVHIKSAQTIWDTVLEVAVTEVREVIDVCHETVKKVDNFSATPEIEEDLTTEESKVTIQEVIQHVKEHVPQTVPEPVVVNLEQEGVKQPDAVTEVIEMVQSGSDEVEDPKATVDRSENFRERREEVSNDVCATDQQVSEDLMQDVSGCLDPYIYNQKDDLKESKAELEQSEADVAGEEVKSNQIIHERTQNPIVTPSNAGSVAHQNSGIIPSTCNVESPSSVSIQVKLNIQLRQASAAALPPPATDMSEIKVQTVGKVEPVNPIQRADSQKQMELTEVADHATETPEPELNSDSDRAGIQPVRPDISIQAMETVEQIKSTERAASSVQAAESIQPVRQAERRAASQTLICKPCEPAQEPVQLKEEHEQDVWMDAKEDLYTREEPKVSPHEVEEHLEPRAEREQEEKVGLEHEFEMTPNSNTEEERKQEMYKSTETCELDSDGEDFAVALEHPESESASVSDRLDG
ncbi:uncharacterized protein LOC115004924 [Cottoperca gobio]|uniref:Uncharacterized protein LOC115004883 n=1 Tax=Cottoperca gobio TaxID=56716 RepID=A0A6J2P8Y8_COTGO|nr:uncharacterized protein LOC115004883 [Cottoperca gobio]XP_029282533.1 uncharacterized protein LOC115004924 [Cottoperca gobio]